MQYCTVQYCTVQYCTVQYCAVRYCTVHLLQCLSCCSVTVRCHAVLFSEVLCSTEQCSAVQCGTVHYSAVQCSSLCFRSIVALHSFRLKLCSVKYIVQCLPPPMCQVSCVLFNLSHVTSLKKNGGTRGRVFYQWGLPLLVLDVLAPLVLMIITHTVIYYLSFYH